MEWVVNTNKKHIKHMFASKTEQNISTKSKAIPSVQHIADNFDRVSGAVIRTKKHSEKSACDDELLILEGLRQRKPFHYQPGRFHATFRNVKASMLQHFDGQKFNSWFAKKVPTFTK